jgi:hypothetical protein
MKRTILSLFLFLFMGFSNLIGKDISAYLIGEYVEPKTAKAKLENAGFDVIAEYKSIKKGVTLVFTNEALKREGAKPNRANAAVLRLFIDKKEKMISFTNPTYFGRAFMQDEYKAEVFQAQESAIKGSFENLRASVDKLEADALSDYHFALGMPYYEDSDELGVASNSELLKKAREYKKGKLLVFELKLSQNSTLLGYDLGKRTKKFVKKIGRANAALLPYCISIEDGKATSLEAKYYLALSYPLLSMSKFMTIATVPGAIKKDLSKPFH